FMGPDGTGGIFGIVLATIVGLVLGFLAMFFTYKDEVQEETKEVVKSEQLIQQEVIVSPIKGDVMPLEMIKDEVFSKGLLGKGVAIEPTEGKVVAPVDGVVTTLFPTYHAIGITSDKGAEILIHVGMDTVQLEGKCFTPKIAQGDKVKAGQLLLEFDIKGIKNAGLPVTTPVIITNSDNYLDVIETDKKKTERKEEIIKVML
ncbi:PTS glucose transporter subunit IIA, partial [Clostridioides difficile]